MRSSACFGDIAHALQGTIRSVPRVAAQRGLILQEDLT